MPTDGVKTSGKSVEQTIDLEELFGLSFEGKRSLRELVGGVLLDHIRERAKSGKAIGGSRDLKKPYSKEYADTLDFKAFGKSRRDVNMTLTGDMLELMDIKSQSANKITLGWSSATENAKAFNHQTGDTVPRRPFFGLTKKELRGIASELKPEIRDALKVREEESRKAFEDRVSELFSLFIDTPDDQDGEAT